MIENANTRALVGTHVVVLAHFEKEVEFLGWRDSALLRKLSVYFLLR